MTIMHSQLLELLEYDPATGLFRWAVAGRGRSLGAVAGSMHISGYWKIEICGRKYRRARLAWFYMTGEWPAALVDHINLQKSDDRWQNLRCATISQNEGNKAIRKDNKSGSKGVRRVRNLWRASIRHGGKYRHLGHFQELDQAREAYARAAQELFGQYARTS